MHLCNLGLEQTLQQLLGYGKASWQFSGIQRFHTLMLPKLSAFSAGDTPPLACFCRMCCLTSIQATMEHDRNEHACMHACMQVRAQQQPLGLGCAFCQVESYKVSCQPLRLVSSAGTETTCTMHAKILTVINLVISRSFYLKR